MTTATVQDHAADGTSGRFPQTQVAIAIDTAYVGSVGSGTIGAGVYMMDNQVQQGSQSEGQLELTTQCPVGQQIGFTVYPIDLGSGDTVVITGFNVSGGDVFGSSGYPKKQAGSGNYWVGKAQNQGSQTYQIQVQVTPGQGGGPYYINWDPFITAV
ncbi:AidA/PixA family protein [Pseudoduganella plicata]|uniref:Uncharacterized protein n=1 Tax=Pseudoduganella plicata TaxID=321984 RepID=A0A4P7BC57_9BURK|nr:hypothetical protein [Pseudoduganella plicata]QBQ35467.1 hypothetical protein E1742_04270 [Pseudoduganella plicata]GGZ02007.1 hypothetical protein GCM10007388_39700 [Pseudoduganella plicata]